MINTIKRWAYPLSFGLVVILAVVSYITFNDDFKVQEIYAEVVISNVTLNMIMLFGVWGLMSDRWGKRLWPDNTKKQWALLVVGVLALMLFFRFVVGIETILG